MDKTAAAIRQQRHRDRRHRGFVCVMVEIGTDDIGGLIDRDLLDRIHQDDIDQVQDAGHRFRHRSPALRVTGDAAECGQPATIASLGWQC